MRDRVQDGAAHTRFPRVALLLQGGGALGAYQGGVYEALDDAKVRPNWIAGISIGAINAAIIAGNAPDQRIERLRAFWERVTESPFGFWHSGGAASLPIGDAAHALLHGMGAYQAIVAGAPGFFAPRFPPSAFAAPGGPEATSLYDASALRTTLETLVDFDRINSKAVRLSVGAVNVRTGNFAYFDTATHTIRPEHILASGALPPGLPAVEIEGDLYWDGGLVSNTPLQWVVDSEPREDTLAFQVDLWSARGEAPRDLSEVAVRQKEIQYSSRTRASTDELKRMQKLRATLASLLGDVPSGLLETEQGKQLAAYADPKVYNIVHLICRTKVHEGAAKDIDFSRLSMEEHWRAGREDAAWALQHPDIFKPPGNLEGFRAFDFRAPAPIDAPGPARSAKHTHERKD
jgi:NTE family protein